MYPRNGSGRFEPAIYQVEACSLKSQVVRTTDLNLRDGKLAYDARLLFMIRHAGDRIRRIPIGGLPMQSAGIQLAIVVRIDTGRK